MKVTTGNHYLAFVLDENCSNDISSLWPSRHPVKKCHHVTIAYNFDESQVGSLQRLVNAKPTFSIFELITTDVVDLFVVMVNGMVMKTDSSLSHLTHAFQEGAQSSDSSRVLNGDIPIKEITPAVFELTGRFELIEKR